MQKQSPKRWGRLSLTAAASSLAIMAATPAVLAQDISAATEQQQVDIPAGPLDDALITAAELFGVTIIAPSELVSGKSSSAITGALNASQTIDQLLSDSDLAFSLSSTGAYVVSRNTAGEARARENLSPAAQDTIVVTGEKFQQSLVDRIPILPQELPFVLNVLDRDFLDARNFTRPAEALTTLPNVQLINDRVGSGGLRFSSRGFEAPILVDNRRQAEFGGSGVRDDSFVERYEVLKGPASIAVGPASTGGVINTVTKSPEADRFTDLMLRVDQFGSLSGEFDVNFGEEVGPDFVLFRVSGAARSFQFDADETKRDEFAIRPVAIFDVTSATSLKVSASYYEQELRRNTGFPLNADGSVPEGIDTDTFTGLQNGIGEVDDTYVDAQIVHDFLDNLKLTVRGSYQRGNISYQNADGLYNFNNVDGVRGLSEANPFVYTFYGFAGDIDNEVLFFDAQLAYQAEMFGQTQDFVIGASYDDTSFERSFNSDTQSDPISLTDLDIPRVGPTTFTPLEPFDKTFLDLRSVFAETALRPKDWLTIVAGVRYDSLEQEGERRGFESLLEEDEVTFRLGASAAVVENLNVYLSFAEAFEPQGGRPQRSGEEVGPVLSTGYEAGLKGTLWNGRAGFEAAIFETTRENLAVADPNNAFGEDFQVTIGEIRLRGAEFSGNVALLDTLDWTVSLGLIDTDVLEAGDDEVTPPFLIPEFNASSFVTYEVGEGNLEGLKLGGGFRHYGDSENGTISNDAYTVADVNISYPIRDDITLSADILNVFDEFYLETGPLPIVTSANQLGQPRTAVITDRARF